MCQNQLSGASGLRFQTFLLTNALWLAPIHLSKVSEQFISLNTMSRVSKIMDSTKKPFIKHNKLQVQHTLRSTAGDEKKANYVEFHFNR